LCSTLPCVACAAVCVAQKLPSQWDGGSNLVKLNSATSKDTTAVTQKRSRHGGWHLRGAAVHPARRARREALRRGYSMSVRLGSGRVVRLATESAAHDSRLHNNRTFAFVLGHAMTAHAHTHGVRPSPGPPPCTSNVPSSPLMLMYAQTHHHARQPVRIGRAPT
jgi:hypothetical protein